MIRINTYMKLRKEGYVTLMALIFGIIFVIIITGLVGLVFANNKLNIAKENRERAVQIAEAGLDYYRWFLAHFPTDLQNGTGGAGPYEEEYSDPEGGPIGKFSLEVSGNTECNSITSVDINSTGWTYDQPNLKREVYGRYARPSVAEFAYIINSGVWAGANRDIYGPYHSNGGIRMDGANYSTVTSGVQNWLCTSSFGCSPDQTQNGVFGAGSGSALWSFPASTIDFSGITLDLVNMKTQAQSTGIYLAPASQGYHLIFKNDGTVDAYRVNNTSYVWGYDPSMGWQQDYYTIASETFLQNYTVPSACSLIFVEDDLWIEGTVKGKVTVASANVTTPNVDPTIILSGNINYTTTNGTDGLTAIAEQSVLIPINSPDDMVLSGIFMAQNGHFGRNYYPSSYSGYKRNSLTMTGTIVSNGRVGTQWTCGGTYCSGYNNRINSYDKKLASDPPPLTPYADDEYKFIEWREVE